MIDRIITNKAFRKAMDAAGMGDIQLAKGDGYFYLINDELPISVESIYIYAFNQMSVAEWVEEIKRVIENAK